MASNFESINGLNHPIDIRTKCNSIPGLTREQIQLCYHATDVTLIAMDGLDLAIHECQSQVGHTAFLIIVLSWTYRLNAKRDIERGRRLIIANWFNSFSPLSRAVSSVPLELFVA